MNTKYLTAASAALALAIGASAVHAQDIGDQSRNDLTCFAVFAAIYGSPDSELSVQERQAVGSGITYYLGRLEGRAPQTDWLAYLRANEQEFYTRVLNEQEFNRCAEEFTAVGARMSAAGGG